MTLLAFLLLRFPTQCRSSDLRYIFRKSPRFAGIAPTPRAVKATLWLLCGLIVGKSTKMFDHSACPGIKARTGPKIFVRNGRDAQTFSTNQTRGRNESIIDRTDCEILKSGGLGFG